MEEVKIPSAEEEVVFTAATAKPVPGVSQENSNVANSNVAAGSEMSATSSTSEGAEGQVWQDSDADVTAPEVETDAAEGASSMKNILPMDKLKNGWNLFMGHATKAYEEQVKPAVAVAAEKTAKFHEETVKPALAVAAEKTAKFHEETVKPAWERTVVSATPYVESAKENASKAWEVTKEKTAEAYEKAKPHIDSCSEQCSVGMGKIVSMVNGKSNQGAVTGPESSDHDLATPSVLDSSTKGSFTI